MVGGFSYHIGKRQYEEVDSNGYATGVFKDYNEVNPSLGFCIDDVCVVASKLSYHNFGVAAFYKFTYASYKDVDFGARIGGVWGYKDTPQGGVINPYASPTVSFPIDAWRVQVGVIPSDPPVATIDAVYKF